MSAPVNPHPMLSFSELHTDLRGNREPRGYGGRHSGGRGGKHDARSRPEFYSAELVNGPGPARGGAGPRGRGGPPIRQRSWPPEPLNPLEFREGYPRGGIRSGVSSPGSDDSVRTITQMSYNLSRYRESRRKNPHPAVDLSETGDSYFVEVELPGVKQEHVRIKIGEDRKSISIEGVVSREGTGTPLSVERAFARGSRFTRTVPFPHPIRPDRVAVKMVDGVLTVRAMKAEEVGVRTRVD